MGKGVKYRKEMELAVRKERQRRLFGSIHKTEKVLELQAQFAQLTKCLWYRSEMVV